MTCGECGATVGGGARFCGGCGAEQLAAAPPTAALSVDVSTMRHFVEGARCLLRLQVENQGAAPLEASRLYARVAGQPGFEELVVPPLGPGEGAVQTLWWTADVAGFHELEGLLHTTDDSDAERFYTFDDVHFRVGAAGTAPVHVVNIDQRSARVVDNSRSSFGAPSGPGGLVGDGEWEAVTLAAVTADQASKRAGRALGRPRRPQRAPSASPRTGVIAGTDGHEYRLGAVLAEGDLSKIYDGTWEDTAGAGGRCVVKVALDSADNDLLRNEVRVLRVFESNPGPQMKHLPRVLDQFRTASGLAGTVLTRCEDAHDLLSVRERYPDGVPIEPMTWIFRRSLSALGFAHARGVVHCNIEPAHILCRGTDHNIFLIDWCYAAVRPGQTGDGFKCINEVYSPPEVAERKPPIPASDLYSLARTMIWLVGGDPATDGLPDGIDPRLARFLRWCVRKSALQRPQDAWQMYDEVDALRRELFGSHSFREFEI